MASKPPLARDPSSECGLSSRLNALFLKMHPHSQVYLDASNHHIALDVHHRLSGSPHQPLTPCGTAGGRIMTPPLPLSPADSYMSLYPAPPHLTPRTSPTHSPRTSSTSSLHPDTNPHHAHAHHPMPTTNLMGKLSITVVEARNLKVTEGAKPYILLQYDRTDSVSREFGAPPPAAHSPGERRNGLKRHGPRNGATNGNSASQGPTTVRRVGPTKQNSPISKLAALPNTPSIFATSPSPSNSPAPIPAESLTSSSHLSDFKRSENFAPSDSDQTRFGTAANPIFNHHASFDVIAPGRTILLCVYDKLAPQGGFPAHGFLGASVFEPPLSAEQGEDGLGMDVWLPLTSALDSTIGGEVRLRILFETSHGNLLKLGVDDFQVLRRIGCGSFGQVFRVRKRDTKRIYAMKVISKKNVTSSEALQQVLMEREVLARTLDSPFLVGLKFSFQSQTDLFFVMDYKAGGELFQHLQRDGGKFDEDKVKFYLSEILLGLKFLHSIDIIYRDLKPENCLLDGSGHVILCDFGLSKLLTSPDERATTLCGTTAFTAPEVLLDEGYDYRCDWWSLGCLLYEMCFGWSPFYAETRVDEYEKILGGEIKIPSKKGYSAAGRELVARLLTRNPDERIGANGGANEIQSHPFFDTISWAALALRQISPPWKPETHADEDACDYHDLGRKGEWMFSSDGGCYSAPSRRQSLVKMSTAAEEEDSAGLFRHFTFIRDGEFNRPAQDKERNYSGERESVRALP